jgi:hypothetical protein
MEPWNYFNYFTEIEEYFWRKRGAALLVSPLDWAIMESWHQAGVPLEAVLKGIDRAFESYARSRRSAGRPLKSLAYCTDAVLEAAQQAQEVTAGANQRSKQAPSEAFTREDLRGYFENNRKLVQLAATRQGIGPLLAEQLHSVAGSLGALLPLLDTPGALDLEDLERRLTNLDEKLHAAVTAEASEALLLTLRREMDGQLRAYRRQMRAEQLALIERQFLQKRLLEQFGLPRLSLYYFL